MWVRRWSLPVLAGVLTLGATVAVAAPSLLTVLRGVERGQWELREDGPNGPKRSICIADPASFIQLRHASAQCSQFVVDNQPKSGVIHYTCPGAGHGRTSIRMVTPRAIEIETQGIAGGVPFHIDVSARRTGACTGGQSAH